MFCTQCGQQSPTTANYCNKCGAPLARQTIALGVQTGLSRDDVLTAIVQTLQTNPNLSLLRNQKTDIEISNTLADANWQVGRKKVAYSACILADTETRTIVFWEMIKEKAAAWVVSSILRKRHTAVTARPDLAPSMKRRTAQAASSLIMNGTIRR